MLHKACLGMASAGVSGLRFSSGIRRVQNISRMQHFEFTSASLTATVRYRESLDDEWMSTDLLKTTKEQLIDAGLTVTPAGGLSLKHQAYTCIPIFSRLSQTPTKTPFAIHHLLLPWTTRKPIPDKAM